MTAPRKTHAQLSASILVTALKKQEEAIRLETNHQKKLVLLRRFNEELLTFAFTKQEEMSTTAAKKELTRIIKRLEARQKKLSVDMTVNASIDDVACLQGDEEAQDFEAILLAKFATDAKGDLNIEMQSTVAGAHHAADEDDDEAEMTAVPLTASHPSFAPSAPPAPVSAAVSGWSDDDKSPAVEYAFRPVSGAYASVWYHPPAAVDMPQVDGILATLVDELDVDLLQVNHMVLQEVLQNPAALGSLPSAKQSEINLWFNAASERLRSLQQANSLT